MEEDDYYLDHYDCQSSKPPPLPPPSMAPPPPLPPLGSSRQSSTDSSGGGPRSLELEDGEAMLANDDEEDYYEDDYDHLYVDTDGAEEYLRQIWTQLGVGDAGYLNLAELYRVCEHIGMAASEEMIEQLFDKLDNDQDGRVSFVEFVDGLFKYVHKTAAAVPVPTAPGDTSKTTAPGLLSSTAVVSSSPLPVRSKISCDLSDPSPPSVNHHSVTTPLLPVLLPSVSATPSPSSSVPSSANSSPLHHATSGGSNNGSNGSTSTSRHLHLDSSSTVGFITIPTDKDGYIESRKILQLWKTLGFNVASTNGDRLLKNLGFNSKAYINVYELWTQLEGKLYHATDNELYQISLATFLNEYSQLKINYEHLTDKCDRYQTNLTEANSRAEFLASEVDEQHLRMEQSSAEQILHLEKKYQDQLRILEAETTKEKEMMMLQTAHLRADIDKQMGALQEQMAKLRKNVVMLEEENKRFEAENGRLKAQNGDLQRSCLEMQRQLEEASHLHAKIVELENYESSMEDQRCQDLVQEVERLKYQNKSLQDQNDELLAEKDTLRAQMSRQSSLILGPHAGLVSGSALPTTRAVLLDANGNPAMLTTTGATTGSNRNKRKRRRKKKKKKAESGSTSGSSKTDSHHQDSSKDVNGNTLDTFDDNMSTISTATIDTCTTIDTDFSDIVHLRSGSRLSRSNSQVEKRQRILFRNSRHSLDDEPLPVEDDGEELDCWDQEVAMVEEEGGPEEGAAPEEEAEEDDDEDELDELDEDPRTLIEGLPVAAVQRFSSLSEEISEWASGRERAAKSKEALRKTIERMLGCQTSDTSVVAATNRSSSTSASSSGQPQIEAVHSAVEKIKDGLYLAMVEVMDATRGGGCGGGNAFTQLTDVDQVMTNLDNDDQQSSENGEAKEECLPDITSQQLSRLFVSYLNATSRTTYPSSSGGGISRCPSDHLPITTTTPSTSTPVKIDQNNNPNKSPPSMTPPLAATSQLPPSSTMDWNDN